jgi:uroporphyrinogen decarboxylase
MEALADLGVPRIIFATGAGTFLEALAGCGAEVVSLDWRTELTAARRRLGEKVVLQGNLDPGCLFLEQAALEERIRRVLEQAGGGRHIFNLGHGILPRTREDRARLLVDAVHRLSARGSADA